jgi:hypothetical protein
VIEIYNAAVGRSLKGTISRYVMRNGFGIVSLSSVDSRRINTMLVNLDRREESRRRM